MAFVVEDGTGLSTATSYVSVAEATAYHADMGNSSWAAASEADQQIALMRATKAVDARGLRSFVGTKGTAAQALLWPREDAVDVNGFDIETNEVPTAVKRAVFEGALIELDDEGALEPSLDRGGQVKKERVEGAVTIEYADSAPVGTSYTAYFNALAPVLRAGGMSVERV